MRPATIMPELGNLLVQHNKQNHGQDITVVPPLLGIKISQAVFLQRTIHNQISLLIYHATFKI